MANAVQPTIEKILPKPEAAPKKPAKANKPEDGSFKSELKKARPRPAQAEAKPEAKQEKPRKQEENDAEQPVAKPQAVKDSSPVVKTVDQPDESAQPKPVPLQKAAKPAEPKEAVVAKAVAAGVEDATVTPEDSVQ